MIYLETNLIYKNRKIMLSSSSLVICRRQTLYKTIKMSNLSILEELRNNRCYNQEEIYGLKNIVTFILFRHITKSVLHQL